MSEDNKIELTEKSGILIHSKDDKTGKPLWIVKRRKPDGTEQTHAVGYGKLPRDLQQLPQGGEAHVSFDILSANPVNIQSFDDNNSSKGGSSSHPAGVTGRTNADGNFHNPYNFIPISPCREAEGLEWHAPAGHAAWQPDLISGSLDVTITAKTPLLLLDTRSPDITQDGHEIFDIRHNEKNEPILTPTAFKGPLRAAFEAVTNSRYGVFKNDTPLGRRMNPQEGLAMIPAMVVDGERIKLLMGTEGPQAGRRWQEFSPKWFKPDHGRASYKQKKNIDSRGKSVGKDTMYAAWLPTYRSPFEKPTYRNGKPPCHKDEVLCIVEKVDRGSFFYWLVRKIAKKADEEGCKALRAVNLSQMPNPKCKSPDHKATGVRKCVEGYVHISHENIRRKHDERVFFSTDLATAPVEKLPNDPKIWKALNWTDLIKDYFAVNEKEFDRRNPENRSKFANGNPAFSRHITNKKDFLQLKTGDLCYAKVDEQGNRIIGLYPVMISRELAVPDASPEKLADSHKPASNLNELSPADQVFGWVHQRKQGAQSRSREAYKGQLRVRSVTPGQHDEGSAIEEFSEPLPLAILSTPKPNQALFYGEDKNRKIGARGEPVGTYMPGMRLRGRKVYPHQDVHPSYWQDPSGNWDWGKAADQNVKGGRVREYLRAPINDQGERKDNQNRSVTGWVKPGTTFTTTIDFENLTPQQLGALLYICGHEGFLKVGAAKPLGFGSVKLAVTGLRGAKGSDIAEAFKSFGPQSPFVADLNDKREEFIEAFKASVSEAYGQAFASVPFIKAFDAAHIGFTGDRPVHYPRPGQPPDARPKSAENFKWFMENKKRGGWLPAMGEGALPYLGDAAAKGGGNGGGGKRHNNKNRNRKHNGPKRVAR